MNAVIGFSDLPTHPYLPVLIQKSAGSTEVRPHVSKYGHRVSRKYENRDVNDASCLPAKPIIEYWWGSYGLVTFAYFKPFPGLKYKAGLDWSKNLLSQWTSTLPWNFMEVSHLPIHGGFEFEAVSDKWLHETDEEEEECTKPRTNSDQTRTVSERMHQHQQKQHTWCIVFGESVLQSSIQNNFADVNKIKSSECSASG